MDNGKFTKIKDKLNLIDFSPTATAVADYENMEILAYNKLFSKLAHIKKKGKYMIADFIHINLDITPISNILTKLNTTEDTYKTILFSCNVHIIDKRKYLICAFNEINPSLFNELDSKINFLDKSKFDVMTGIYNKEAGELFLEECMHKSKTSFITICYFNLDKYKELNKTYGESVSNKYIMNVVSIIKGTIRKTDFFARMSEDSFLLVFPKCRYSITETIMDTVSNKLEAFNKKAENPYKASIDYGIVELTHGKFENVNEVIQTAISDMQDEF